MKTKKTSQLRPSPLPPFSPS